MLSRFTRGISVRILASPPRGQSAACIGIAMNRLSIVDGMGRTSKYDNDCCYPSSHYNYCNGSSCPFSTATTMDLIKDLRARSGAPIVDCQKALKHSNGDIDGAVDWLREHGAAKASLKVQGRETVEGLIGINISPDGKVAAMVKVASETDFAGRSAMFVKLVKDVAEQATNQQIRDDDEGEIWIWTTFPLL